MRDELVFAHDDKTYAIAVDDLGQYEVTDDAAKADIAAERDAALNVGDDEVEGFARLRGPSSFIFIRQR
jgi:VIT1/CCC1 family predicted Fe2+/Mn2+ transporter